MITVHGPDWPSVRSLRDALASVPEEGEITWGRSPCDKLTALQRLRDAGVEVPEFTRDLAQARSWLDQGHEVWGRKLTHSHGTDIAMSRVGRNGWVTTRRWRESHWWVRPVLEVAYEVRAHVWGGKVFRLGVKQFHGVPPGRPAAKSQVVRSDRNGWGLSYGQETFDRLTTEEARRACRRTAVAACAALGVPGGAVDLLVTTSGRVVCLEVNTAPALGEHTLAAWVERIRRVVRRESDG